MRNRPFFSIITCTRNSSKFLDKNINSVKKQTFKDYEHIFIDGESSDDTVEMIKKYQKHDPRVKIFSYPPKGIANAFNMGIKHARGKYLIHLNSDDYLYNKNSLSNAYKFLVSHSEADWIYGMVDTVDQNGKELGLFPKYKIFQTSNVKLLKLIDYIPHQAVFIKKETFDKFGYFDEKVKYITDYEYWLRIADKTKWLFINKTISNFTARIDSASLSRKHKDELKRDTLKFHRKYSSLVEHYIFSILNHSIFADIYRRFRYTT